MQNYMFLFHFPFNPDYQPSPEDSAAEHRAWGEWIGDLASKIRFVDTRRLVLTGAVVTAGAPAKSLNLNTGDDVIGGNMIVKAESLEDAISLTTGCPVLHAGGRVEIREIMENQAE